MITYVSTDSYSELRAVTSLGALHHTAVSSAGYSIYTPASVSAVAASGTQSQHQRMASPYQPHSPSLSYQQEYMHSGSLSPKIETLSPTDRSPAVMSGSSPTGFELDSPHIVNLGNNNNNNNNNKIVMGNGESVAHSNMDRPTVVSMSS